MDFVNSELFEEEYHFTHHFVPPNQHTYYHKKYKQETSIESQLPEFSTIAEIDKIAYNAAYDVIFTVVDTGHHILAHRKKLASESFYFDSMFSGYFVEAYTFEIKIHGVSTVALRKLVKFCYTKCIRFEPLDVEDVVAAANLMMFDDIVEEGLNYLKTLLQPQTCLTTYTFAQEHNFEKLASFAMEYAKFYFVQVSKTNQFLEISLKFLNDLLKTKEKIDLENTNDQNKISCTEKDFCHGRKNVHSPFELFYAVLKWINFDANLREPYIFDLLTHIPFAESYQRKLLKEQISYLEKLGIKYGREKFYQQFECERNTLNSSDAFEFIMFQLGYNELKVYCPVFNEFRLITKFDHNIQCFGQCLFEDKIIMAGGLEKDPNNDLLVNSRKVTYLSLQNFILYNLPSMKYARTFPGVAILDNAIYVSGGDVGTKRDPHLLDCVERYDLVTKQWTSVTPMVKRRARCFMCAIGNNRLYVIGGTNPKSLLWHYHELSMEYYDSQKEEWNILANLETSPADVFNRLPNVHFVFNNIIHFVLHPKSCMTKMFKYDDHSNSWILVKNGFQSEYQNEYKQWGEYSKIYQKYPIIHSEEKTLIFSAYSNLHGMSDTSTLAGKCFMLYKIDTISGNCKPISAPWQNRFSVSKKILARNSILRPEEFRANIEIITNS